MSTNKNFDRVCCIILAIVIVISVLFVNGEKLGITIASKAMGYEQKLFDKSYVHTIDIVMDDWDSFLETCTSEEYTACSVVIDNEAFKNVAIRGKGNTSLSSVKNYGNNRYSFKIEFDAYDKNKTYHGLDKLCLNNIIQDNTYIKDYIVYTMMNEFGVSSSLCSFVFITVNGEDWGLYLAVEGVEDSFLQRNYGNDDVDLYKPDSMSMGGGRGNGEGFDMDEFEDKLNSESDSTDTNSETSKTEGSTEQSNRPTMPSGENSDSSNGSRPTPPNGNMWGGQTSDSESSDSSDESRPTFPNGQMPGNFSPDSMPELPDGVSEDDIKEAVENGGFSFGGKGGGMFGSDDVKLVYTDDEYDSYSNIFNNAKTKISDSDKDRLIASLKSLNENTDIEETVDVEQVIRYFVVHNFVLNGDSYTGSMIHNYYLTENDGQLSMVPWDYNLAFGGFQSMGGATSLVNSPIDSPVSGGTTDSRPMLAWIFNNEEYTEQYHELFDEFISSYFESGKFAEEIDRVKEMISPYVEKDPTKFCSYDEFIKGIDTLKEFCLLRAESVRGQLDGTIGSTSEAQSDESGFISAEDITISDMGSMGNMGGGGNGMPGGNRPDGNKTEDSEEAEQSEEADQPEETEQAQTEENEKAEETTQAETESATNNAAPPEGFSPDNLPEGFSPDNMPEGFSPDNMPTPPDGNMPSGGFTPGNMPSGGFPSQN